MGVEKCTLKRTVAHSFFCSPFPIIIDKPKTEKRGGLLNLTSDFEVVVFRRDPRCRRLLFKFGTDSWQDLIKSTMLSIWRSSLRCFHSWKRLQSQRKPSRPPD